MNEVKNEIEAFNSRLNQAENKESMNSKTDHLKLSCHKRKMNEKEKKRACRICGMPLKELLEMLLDLEWGYVSINPSQVENIINQKRI